MASNPFFSGRIPPELHRSVEKHCEETGKSKTEVLINALSSYLNIPAPDKNNEKSEVTKEMYDSLVTRIDKLEKLSAKAAVINSDNREDNKVIVRVIPQHNNRNYSENNSNITEENITNKSQENLIDKNKDKDKDKDKNTNQKDLNKIKLKGLTNKEVLDISNISSTQISRLKTFIIKKAKEKGYIIEANTIFSNPIEAIQKTKDILVEGKKSKLICLGFDSKTKPIWELIADDKETYQLDIIT